MPPLRRLIQVAVIAALLLAAASVAAAGARSYESNDFFCLWSAGRVVLRGDSPYDRTAWAAATAGLHPGHDGTPGPSACTARFAYPLWTAIALVPLGALPLDQAAVVWIALAIAATIAGTAAAWHAFGGPPAGAPLLAAIVVGSQPFWLLLVGAQITGLLLGVAGLACLAIARDRLRLAGALLGALILKPQLVALLLPAVSVAALAGRRWRLIVGMAGAVAALGLSAFILDPGWLGPWLAEVGDRSSGLAPRLATLWGFADDVLGGPLWAVALIAGCGVGAAWIVRGRAVPPVLWLALAMPWSLAAAPHAWSYDQLLLVIPWAATLACAMRLPPGARLAILVALTGVASLLPWLLYVVAFARGQETLSAAVPVLTLFLTAYAVRTAAPAVPVISSLPGAPPRR